MIKYVYNVITDNKAMFTRKTNKNIIEINNTREVFMIYLLVDKDNDLEKRKQRRSSYKTL